MNEPLAFDIYSGDGGAGMGYARAGYSVRGFDNEPHPYPIGPFEQVDAGAVLWSLATTGQYRGLRPALVHTSPPCKIHTPLAAQQDQSEYVDYVPATRALLQMWAARFGGIYVIENVEGAPLENPITLCGSEFGLGATCRDGKYRFLKRHRLFESNAWLMGAGGCHHKGQPVGVYGTGGGGQMTRGYKAHPEEAREAMGIDWMKVEDICQAIPPAFTEFIGQQVLDRMEMAA